MKTGYFYWLSIYEQKKKKKETEPGMKEVLKQALKKTKSNNSFKS